jgi:murein DD-endopeptidase MepM/ murein hydrolase activator NlpD
MISFSALRSSVISGVRDAGLLLVARAEGVRQRLHETHFSAWQVVLAIASLAVLMLGGLALSGVHQGSTPSSLSSAFGQSDAQALRNQLVELHRRMETMEELKEQFATIANPLPGQLGNGKPMPVIAKGPSSGDAQGITSWNGQAVDVSELLTIATLMNQRLEAAEQQWLLELKVLHQLPTGSPIANHSGMSSDYGTRLDPFTKTLSHHAGIDFSAPQGTPILATGDGVVAKIDVDRYYGQYVEIEHTSGFTTRYAHVSRFAVRSGESVKRGQVIANVGNTGRSTSPHLHYEIRYQGIPINPLQALAPRGNQQVARSAVSQ